ncbi:MAG: N-acyl homoserine lactonase family protein [Spirochaetes bacterium]|nr:N-acyl homoserine lactonase family protein [Spirochaetota bacterium]
MKTKLAIIETGLWYVPRNEIIKAETPEIYAENRRHLIPGFVVLVDHPKLGKILFDTGNADDWQSTWNDTMKQIYSFEHSYKLADKLKEMGLTPGDIDILIQSHLHYDHAGNIGLFKNTKAGKQIILTKAEAREAFVNVNLDDTGYSGAYWKREFLNIPGIGYKLIEEDTKLADDVELFIQVGHTPGVIGMIVHTENSGSFIFTSDAIYSSNNFGPPIVFPGLCTDPDNYAKNIERVRELQKKYNAKVVFSHDVEDFKAWKKSPHFYD